MGQSYADFFTGGIIAGTRPASWPKALPRSEFFGDLSGPTVMPIRPLATQPVAQRLEFGL
jgi:hypothetical protein